MCGKDLKVLVIFVPMIRITPACAGRTWDYDAQTAFCEDHPRMCGKDSFFL